MGNGRVPCSKHPQPSVGLNRRRNWPRCLVRTTWYPDILNRCQALDSEEKNCRNYNRLSKLNNFRKKPFLNTIINFEYHFKKIIMKIISIKIKKIYILI